MTYPAAIVSIKSHPEPAATSPQVGPQTSFIEINRNYLKRAILFIRENTLINYLDFIPAELIDKSCINEILYPYDKTRHPSISNTEVGTHTILGKNPGFEIRNQLFCRLHAAKLPWIRNLLLLNEYLRR